MFDQKSLSSQIVYKIISNCSERQHHPYSIGFNDVTSGMHELFVKTGDPLRIVQNHFRCESSALYVTSPLQLPHVPFSADDAFSIPKALFETWAETLNKY